MDGGADLALAAGQFEQSLALARAGLADDPDAVDLLRIAGRASLELGDEDATMFFDRLTVLRPDDSEAWIDLGLAHAAWGDVAAAVVSLDRAVKLEPSGTVARLHLAHSMHATGRVAEAIDVLEAVAEVPDETVQRARMDLSRSAERWIPALDAAERLLELEPDDVPALLTLAEVKLELGDFVASFESFRRLASVDSDDGHATIAVHGQIEALLCCERWRAAMDIAIDATRLDRHQLTTDLLAFCANRLFGERARPAPSFDELLSALASERAQYRRLHLEEAVS